MIRSILKWFVRPSARFGTGTLFAVGGVAGVIFWGGFNTFMEYTNTMDFCISCHEMQATVYQEYKKTVHYQNTSGVRATCADCHVPKPWVEKFVRKVYATNELYHHILGDIDTPEKFEARRLTLAKHVWGTMEKNGSRECRNCHAFETMDISKQRADAQKQHPVAIKDGETCISCHKGIAHKLPDMSSGYKLAFEELAAASAKLPATASKVYTLRTKKFYLDKEQAKANAKYAGQILPASDVTILARDGDLLKVRIDGWQQDGAAPVVYAAMGRRILTAALAKEAIASLQLGADQKDADTDQIWRKVSLEGWTDKSLLTDDEKKIWSYAGEMLAASCGTCHSLRHPDHYLANQWIGVLNAMKRFVTIDQEEYRFLQRYLQINAKDMVGAQHGKQASANH